MKIFFISSWYPNPDRPNEGMFMKNISQSIALYNDVTLFFADEQRDVREIITEEYSEHNVKVRVAYYPNSRTPFKLLNLLLSSLRRIYWLHWLIAREMKTGYPQLFHFNIVSPSIVLMIFYRLFYGVPIVYSEHWDIPLRALRGLQKKGWLPWKIGYKICSSISERTMVHTKAVKESFEHYGLAKNIVLIPSVVQIPNDNVDDTKRLTGTKVFVHISSLDDAQKNITGMLESIAMVAAIRSDFEVHILGKGAEFQKHYDYAYRLGFLDKMVFFHGFVSNEEKIQWLEKSIAHIMFSNFEGYSLVTAEAIFLGRPAIATDCGGPTDFVNKDNGIIVQPKDKQAFAEAIQYMLDNYLQYEPQKLRDYGRQTFSPGVVGLLHDNLYTDVLR